MKAELIKAEIKSSCSDIDKVVYVIVPEHGESPQELIGEILKVIALIVYIALLLNMLLGEIRLINHNPQLLLPKGKPYLN